MREQQTLLEDSECLIEALIRGCRHDPHRLLGLQTNSSGERVIRLFRPGANRMHLELLGYIVEMRRVHPDGLFELAVSEQVTNRDYRIFHSNGLLAHDPYTFLPTFGDLDAHLFSSGTHYELYKKMGGRLTEIDGVRGVAFSVWAPSAFSVALIGDINHWDSRALPMRSLGSSGVWELFVPGMQEGDLYKFEVEAKTGERCIKTDPLGLHFELRPHNGACVVDPSYEWTDNRWMQQRQQQNLNRPVNIYEVHLGSWKRKDGAFVNYRELAKELAEYCIYMGFTHVELLPISEHPLDESWGYQVTGYFAPTSRHGSFSDFQYFVNHLHESGIGVILDWVPGHFPTDDFALSRFDRTALYEHEDPRQGFHPHWSTHIFNFSRHEVSNFLLASALSWLDFFHIDGLRVDAVASMLYLDYGRQEGEWIPNKWGGNENLEALEFLRHTNSIVHDRFPGVLTIAEESTSFPGITQPLDQGGVGFDLKWNMGWMNDTLRYFSKDPIYRSHHQNDLTFGLLYAFTEKFSLVLSHDEVVHGKKSLLSKMPGDTWQQFANLRLLLSYMICQPGKKLLFMGADVATWDEWSEGKEMQWFMLDYPSHRGIQNCIRDLNRLYVNNDALWSDDFSYKGFEWVSFDDSQNSVIAYLRKSEKATFLCVHNFTPRYFEQYSIALDAQEIREVFNSDALCYGGSGKDGVAVGKEGFCLPPLSTVIYEVR